MRWHRACDCCARSTPDVVISSAFQGDSAVHRIDAGRWPEHVDQALDGPVRGFDDLLMPGTPEACP